MAFAAQRVREEAEDAEKVEFFGVEGVGRVGKHDGSYFEICFFQVPSRYSRNLDPMLEVNYGNLDSFVLTCSCSHFHGRVFVGMREVF